MTIQFHTCKIEGDWEAAAQEFVDRMSVSFDALSDGLSDKTFKDAVDAASTLLADQTEILNKLLRFGSPELNSTDKLKELAGLPTPGNDNRRLSALGLVNFDGSFLLPLAGSRNWEEIQILYNDIGQDYELLKEILNGAKGVLVLIKKDPTVFKVLSASGLAFTNIEVNTRLGKSFTKDDVTYQDRTRTAYATEAKFENINARVGPINTSLHILGEPEFTVARINNLQNLGLDDLRLAAAVNSQSLELLALSTITTQIQAVISTLQSITPAQTPTLISERVAVAKIQWREAFELTAHRQTKITEPHLIDWLENRIGEDKTREALDTRTDIISIDMAATAVAIREAITLVISSTKNRAVSAALRNPEIDRKALMISDSYNIFRLFAFVEDLLAEAFYQKPLEQDESVHSHSQRFTDFTDDGQPLVQIDFPATDSAVQTLIVELASLLVLVQETASSQFTTIQAFGLAQDGVTSVPITNIGFNSDDTPNQLVDRNLDLDSTTGILNAIAGLGNMLVKDEDGNIAGTSGDVPLGVSFNGNGCIRYDGPRAGVMILHGDWTALHIKESHINFLSSPHAPRAAIGEAAKKKRAELNDDGIKPILTQAARNYDRMEYDIPDGTELWMCGRGSIEMEDHTHDGSVSINIKSWNSQYPAPYGQANVVVDVDVFVDRSDLLDFEISLGGLGVMLTEGLTRMLENTRKMNADLNRYLQELAGFLSISFNMQGEITIDTGFLKCSIGIQFSPTLSLLPLLTGLLDGLLFVNSLLQTLFNLIRKAMCLPICILDAVLNLGPTAFPGGIPFCQISIPEMPTGILDMLKEVQGTLNFGLTLQNFKASEFSSGLIPKIRKSSNGWALVTQTSCDCPNDVLTSLFG